jgi:hypothetical protein
MKRMDVDAKKVHLGRKKFEICFVGIRLLNELTHTHTYISEIPCDIKLECLDVQCVSGI